MHLTKPHSPTKHHCIQRLIMESTEREIIIHQVGKKNYLMPSAFPSYFNYFPKNKACLSNP